MRIDVLTLFPEMFAPLQTSIMARAQTEGHLNLHLHNLRDWGMGNYNQVDDTPYGGGAGMLLRCDVVATAIEAIQAMAEPKAHAIYLSARGQRLTQPTVETLGTKHERLLLLCGHYEGVDQRVMEGGWIDEEIRIGDYVLTGGELPAMVLIDSVIRLLPGVVGTDESVQEESFSPNLDRKQEYPHYTRPAEFKGLTVPDVLTSGHHGEIEKWRKNNCQV
jgi:tRNA (guanine37-N1)-methyltransferase